MMTKILITGNGFDRSLHLPTLYKHFMDITDYLLIPDPHEFEDVYGYIGEDSLKIFENYNAFEFNERNIVEMIQIAQSNLWFNFFQNESRINTWIDFENRIEYLLDVILNSLKKIKENPELILAKDSTPHIHPKKVGLSIIDSIELARFGIFSGGDLGTQFFSPRYIIMRHQEFYDFNFQKISEDLNRSLNDFKKLFNLYLETFVIPLYNNIKEQPDLSQFLLIEYHFTFNYTPSFEALFDFTKYRRRIDNRYIHGITDSKQNKIVLGIDEIPEMGIDTSDFIPFTKTHQTLLYDTDHRFLEEVGIYNESEYSIYFYGHSLDSSDKEYINEVFEFQKKLKYQLTIVVIYHNTDSKTKLISNLIKIRGRKEIRDWSKRKQLIFLKSNSKALNDHLLDKKRGNVITARSI
ncbi:AbiH family protein [Mangrovimonas sp. YM274]|uniref:AbiH family protein n=1 Tax=Mangrovimonas sp. YM274 TaxID=3070660 RepID=UPI0027DDE1D3|nr:AbiH family protein [Mangrovimonas sp. YM274]WMI70270.1 AbiH family protein [Mangrovimonas sp. YM274]